MIVYYMVGGVFFLLRIIVMGRYIYKKIRHSACGKIVYVIWMSVLNEYV